MKMPGTISPKEAGELIGLGYISVMRLIKSGEIRAVNLSTKTQPRYRVRVEEVEAFVRRRMTA